MKTKISAFPGRVIFDHLPKTAGTAVTAWLTRELGSGCITPQLDGHHGDQIRRFGGIYSIICAHMNYLDGERLDPRYSYITCLREPVDRAISWLYYAINDFEPVQNATLRASVTSLIESDGQQLADDLIPSISNLYVNHFSPIAGTAGVTSNRFSVQHCVNVLSQYDVVGFQDDIPAFVHEVSEFLGLKGTSSVENDRVNLSKPKTVEVSMGLRNRLIELNQLDLRLYEELKRLHGCGGVQRSPRFSPWNQLPWARYERVDLNGVVSTPDLIVARAVLKEGPNIMHGQLMSIEVDLFLTRDVRELGMVIRILDSEKRLAFGTNNALLGLMHDNVNRGAYRVLFHLVADLPAGPYNANLVFSERVQYEFRELVLHGASFEFYVHQQADQNFAGYAYLPAEITLTPSHLAIENNVVVKAVGHLLVISGVSAFPVGARATLLVELANHGEQIWLGDVFRPVFLSYHWLDVNGNMVVADGERSALPQGGIRPGQVLRAPMQVAAPDTPGEYHLTVTLVQETVGWFETLGEGFQPATIPVAIVPVETEASSESQLSDLSHGGSGFVTRDKTGTVEAESAVPKRPGRSDTLGKRRRGKQPRHRP